MKKNLITAITSSILTIFVMFMFRGCDVPNGSQITPVFDSTPYFHTIDTVTLINETLTFTEKDSILWNLIPKDSIIYNPIYKVCDSLISEFAIERTYLDSVLQDSSTKVLVHSIVQYNKLKSQNFQIINFRPVSYETKKQVRTAVLLGATLQRSNRTNTIIFNVGVGTSNYSVLGGVGVRSWSITVLKSINFKK